MISSKFLRLRKVLKGIDFYCFPDIKLESVTYGNKDAAWTIYPAVLNGNSIVYSFGVGEDISFDLSIIENHNVSVLTFDPTPKSVKWIKGQHLPSKFMFAAIGIAAYDGIAKFSLPENPDYVSATIIEKQSAGGHFDAEVKRLSTIMKLFNHSKIDILKMDIEGAEYDVIDDILASNINVKQILIEFHHRFSQIGIAKSKNAIKKLRNAGYKVFSVSDNGEEISFIKM
jgi:FkbM family methyltransferase